MLLAVHSFGTFNTQGRDVPKFLLLQVEDRSSTAERRNTQEKKLRDVRNDSALLFCFYYGLEPSKIYEIDAKVDGRR